MSTQLYTAVRTKWFSVRFIPPPTIMLIIVDVTFLYRYWCDLQPHYLPLMQQWCTPIVVNTIDVYVPHASTALGGISTVQLLQVSFWIPILPPLVTPPLSSLTTTRLVSHSFSFSVVYSGGLIIVPPWLSMQNLLFHRRWCNSIHTAVEHQPLLSLMTSRTLFTVINASQALTMFSVIDAALPYLHCWYN
jgi:hypothetical protein